MSVAISNASRQNVRNLPQLLVDAQAACQRLAIASRSWPVFLPSTPAIDEAMNTVEGLRLTLCELRPHTTTPTHAA